MKTAENVSLLVRHRVRRSPRVKQEIERYLAALVSYPESVSRDPGLRFDKHLMRISSPDSASVTRQSPRSA